MVPNYILRSFTFMNSTRVRGLITPRCNTLYMQRSFASRAARLWNRVIPYDQRHFSHSFSEFKNILFTKI